jgi:hypothetical protein
MILATNVNETNQIIYGQMISIGNDWNCVFNNPSQIFHNAFLEMSNQQLKFGCQYLYKDFPWDDLTNHSIPYFNLVEH